MIEKLIAPEFITQPTTAVAAPGATATIPSLGTNYCSVTNKVLYQWMTAGTNITGATNATFTKNNVQNPDAGDYQVVISDYYGAFSITSQVATLIVSNTPPIVTVQPLSITTNAGNNVTLSLTATGGLPINYKWYFNDVLVTTTATNTLVRTNAQQAVAGNYYCIMTNSGGATTSAVATLTITDILAVFNNAAMTNRTTGAGLATSFTNSATGTEPITYQWFVGTTPIPNATNKSYAIASASTADSGSYALVAYNSVGSSTSAVATLTVTNRPPNITSQPSSVTTDAGNNASFLVSGSSPLTINYQWYFQGNPIPGANSSLFSRTNVQQAVAGSYYVVLTNAGGVNTSGIVTLTVNPVTVAITVTSSTNRALGAGTDVPFTATTKGTEPYALQWQFNSVSIPGATSGSYTVTNAQTGNSGSYILIASNAVGWSTSVVSSLTITNMAPQITQQPAGITIPAGTNGTLTVVAIGATSYQWTYNGGNIGGATNSTYTIVDAQAANQGAYAVNCINATGSTPSANASVFVTARAPYITMQPASMSVNAGTNFTLAVSAIGTKTWTHQWRFEGTNIPGATGPTYTLNGAQPANQGNYSVALVNSVGTTYSSNAYITVIPSAPFILEQPKSRRATIGSCVTFSVVAGGSPPFTYQWKFFIGGDWISLDGATSPSYTYSDAQLEGDFLCEVSNARGSVSSDAAALTLVENPIIESVQRSGNNLTVNWHATANREYQLQYTTNLTNPRWENDGFSTTATGCSGTTTVPTVKNQNRYYRVFLLPE